MSRREKEKKESLRFLARFAARLEDLPEPEPKREAPKPPPQPKVRPKRAPKPEPKATPKPPDPFEGRLAKQDEERLLRERRMNELHRSRQLEFRQLARDEVPFAYRRAAFNRQEPSLADKIGTVLGSTPSQKEGRAKNRERGRRNRGR